MIRINLCVAIVTDDASDCMFYSNFTNIEIFCIFCVHETRLQMYYLCFCPLQLAIAANKIVKWKIQVKKYKILIFIIFLTLYGKSMKYLLHEKEKLKLSDLFSSEHFTLYLTA